MKRKKLLIIVIAIICLFVSSGTIINNVITLQKHKEAKAYNSEQDLIGSYEDANSETVEDEDNNEIRNLEVNAYFLDEGGNKKRGIYKTFTAGAGDTHSSEYVTLFVDLGLSQDNAYIKNGRISLSNYNAIMIPTLSKGGVIEEVNDNNDDVKLTNISSGNSVHLGFQMKQSVIWDNGEASKEPYSKLNTVKIEGDYYDDSSEAPRHFTKEINWQLDWNADTEIDKVEIVNKLEGNGNLILLNDNRMAAIFEVTSKNKENGAIPVVGEYKMSGFKIHDIAPEITVSDVTVSRNHFSIENSTYDKTSDTLTWKSHRDNADKRQVIDWGFKSYITVVYPAELYNKYLNGKTDTVETKLNLEAKNMAYVNPNIQYKQKSLIDNEYPKPGTRYTEPGNASLKLQFNNHDGKLYKYETEIKEQSKINSELIYYGVDTSAGYKEDCNVTVNAGGNIVSGVKIDWDNNNPAEHSFMDNSGNYYSHEDLKCYTGIYIESGTMNLLGENGWIEVYGVPEDSNTDNFSRIDRYTTDGKHDYNKKYKKIRIITSAVKVPGTISLSNLVEINNNKLKGKYTSEVFEKFTRLAASSNAYIKIGDNEEYTDPYSAYTEVDYTTGTLKLNVSGPVKADTYETSTIKYSASLAAEDYSIDKSQSSITYYNNPKVLVEFPITVKSKHTKFVKNTLEVTSGGKTMKAKISNRLTKDGKDYFIININGTTNSSIDIKASFDVVPNTIEIKKSTDVKNRRIRTFTNTTYDGTTIIGNVQGGWWNSTEGPDTYDMNGNGITTEGDYFYENTEIIFTEPVGVRTVTSLALDGSEEEVLSPGVMELDKNKDGGKEVTVNNKLYNYSDATLKKLKLVGRIPYKGNKFLKSGDDMGSTFDTTMQSGIKLPTGLEGVTVKYSTEEINIKDISSVSNIESKYNWTTNFNTDAKSYMIDFGNTDIDKGSVYNFTYKIKLPETLDYGFASYTSNAILFNVLEEEKEIFATPVESPKVGLSIESQNVFDIDFEKVDKDNNNKKLTGAKYTLTRTDGKQIKQGENWVDSIELGSDTGSTFSVSGLYPEVEYKLEETTAPANYKMQNVVFKIVADENSKWKIEVSEGILGNESFDSSNSYSIKCKINILEELDNADYKVEYYYQNTEGEYKQKTERQPVTRSDKIGKTVSVTEDDKKPIYDGYELSTTHNTSEQTGKVKSDGTTVLKVYFELSNADYKVEYYYQNTEGEYKQKTERQPVTRSDKIGKTVSVTEDDKKTIYDGYELSTTHNTSEQTGEVKSDGTTVLKVYFELSNADYKVEYYYQNTEGEYKQKTERQPVTRSDKIGKTVSVTEDDKKPIYDGYELSTTHNTSEQTGKVKSDGTTVLKVYFELSNADYKVEYYYQNTEGEYKQKTERQPVTRSDKIGKTVSVTEDDKKPIYDGYELSTTHNTSEQTGEVKSDGTTVLKVYFELSNADYKVEYYYQNTEGEYKQKTERQPVTRSDKIGKTVSVTEDDKKPIYDGYELSTTHNTSEQTGEVKSDGTTVLKVYFELSNADYKVEYYYQNTEGEYKQKTERQPVTRSDKIGKTVSVTEDDKKPIYDGYELSTTHNTSEQTGKVKSDGTTVLKVYFELSNADYKVEYYYQNTEGGYKQKTERQPVTRSDKIGKTVSVTEDDKKPIYDGYELSTTHNTSEQTGKVKSDGTTVLKVYFELSNADYKVEYYYQNTEGEYKQKTERQPVTRSDKIGKTVSVTEDDKKPIYDGYELSTTHNTSEQTGKVKSDGTTVLKVYFDIMKVKYTIEYYFLNDNGIYPKNYVYSEIKGPVNVGTTISCDQVTTDPNKVTNKPDGNYLLDDEDQITTERTDSSLVINKDESKNVFKVYFTKGYTVTYLPGKKGAFEKKSKSDIPYGTQTPLLIGNKTGKPGYTFTGWLEENTDTPLLEDTTISNTHVTHDITYIAQWKANENTPYQVWFYYQENGKYPNEPFAKVINRTATTDTNVKLNVSSKVNDLTVKVTDSKAENEDISRPKTGANYIFDNNAGNILEASVNGDGLTVLKVYFKQIPVKYNFDTRLKDTKDNTLTQNKFTITRAGTINTDETVLWDNKAVSDGVEINENNLLIDTYTYKVTENETPNEKYVNVLNGKYVSVTVAISDEGIISISSWKVCNNDGTEVAKNDSVYQYVSVKLEKVPGVGVSTIKVEVTNPVRFTFEVKKKDSEGNNLEDTGISIKSEIIDGQNAAHRTEIETESKNGLQITENGDITGETNKNGVIKYEETWVKADTYTYEIRETKTSGNQYVNILDGYKILVTVKVNSDGTLEIVKNGDKNYKIVSAESGEPAPDNLYKYVNITVSSNSLNAIIDYTGHVDIDITNPVKFNINLIEKDTKGNDLDGTKFTVTRNKETIFDNKEVTNGVEINEGPVDAGTYTYTITENSTKNARYTNILENRNIKLNVKVSGDGHIDVLDQGENNFKVFENTGAEVTDKENVLKFIEVWTEVANNGDQAGVSTINVKVVNPVKYKVDIATATTAYGEKKNIDDYFLDNTDVKVYRKSKDEKNVDIYSGQPIKGVECTETPMEAGDYEYYFTQTSTKNNKFVNPLDGKFVRAQVKVSETGMLEIGDIDLFEGTIGDQYVNRLTNDEAEKYIKVNVDNSSDISTLKIVIIDPVRFTVEVKKLDTEEKQNGIEDTEITINSSVVNEQNAAHSEKTKETSESKDGLDINSDGNVSGTTNSEGKVKYEETWVNSNESPELSGDNKNYYTYEITEDETAGNQYVNVLKGYKIIVRVKVSPEGVLTLVDKNGKAYNANAKIKFTIVDAKTGKAVATDNIAYNYVSISVENDSLSAVISKTGKLNVDITNPVRFNIDLIKKDTSGEFLSGTKFTVTRGKETIFNNSEVTKDIEIKEDPINAGVYTYYIREKQTNTSFGNRYVNILDGKYIKIKVKVNGNGVIDILDNEDEKNDDYYEVYEDGKTQKVTDDNILKYISVKSHDEDGDGVYTVDVQVINPIRYEIDIITLDTLGNFLNDTNVTLYKDENDGRKELFTGNATDVNKIKKVEKVEIPAETGTYTYYAKENQAKSERYVNVIDGRYIKIQLTVNSNGMLTVTNELYEGDLGKGTKVETGSVFNYYSVEADNSSKEDVSRLNITLINPVKFVMEVDKYDTAENPLNGTTFEIESPIIGSQKHEHNNEKISGIADDGITSNGVITGVTDNAIEKSPNGNMQRARISYEETWVDANKTDNDYYTYIIKETKTSGAQYVNILEGYQIVLKVHVDAEGNLALKETNGRNYEIVKVDANAENITDEVYKYVKINVSNNKILATLNTEVINPVRYNIAVYQTIYGDEKIKLKNIPVEIQSEFSGNTTLVTDENGYTSMEEKAVWEGKYNYKILQLNEYKGQKVEDEFVNMLDGYYISIDLNVHSDGVIKTMSADGDETTVSYKLYKKQKNGRYEEVDFNDTIVDDFVKVKVTTSDDNVCTLNVYIITPEKYDFKLMKTDIDVLASKEKFENKYKAISENMNDVEFSVVAKDANGEIVLKNTLSGKDAKTEFEKINTKEQKTKNVDNTDGIILFDNILIERAGTYTFEITEVTPIVEGMVYKDKSESIIITAEIVEENGKYVLKNMQIPQAERYTIAKNTKITGTETQIINVNVSNERIKGQYDLTLNKVSKLTGKPLDGAVYKVTVEQDGKENKTLYISDGDVLSKNEIIPYVGDENQDITGTATTAFNNIRIEIPETYTIKIEEIKAPETFTKLDDVIELEVTTGIEGEYDDAHYVLKEVKLKEGNHDLISETHSKAEDEKQNINVQIENEFFDLALKQYVTDVNGTEITSRKPEVTVTKEFNDGDATTAEYKQVKDVQRAYAGQEVIYTIEVFNEGIIDGYAEEIVQHLPEGLEFVDDELNKSFGWEYDKANNQVVTKVLSKEANKDNFIPAYNKETQTISSKKIQLKLKVSDNVKLKTKLTTIAEITASLAKDRKEALDRDSSDLVAMPETEKLAEYTENQEDDDDFEKLIIEEFDLAPVKYIKSVNGKDCDERWAQLKLDPERSEEYKNGVFNGFKYKSDNEMLKLKQNDMVVYGINVYNEGSVKAYAKEVKDTIPSGLVFIKDSEINKKYGWKMLDSDGNVTDDVNKAVCVVTDYLANDAINELSIENNTVNVDSKTVEVEFKIVEPNTKDRIIENKAEVSKYDDDQGINPKDRDPEERLQENIERVYVKIFDLELEQVISSIEVTNTKTNEKTVTNSDEIRKLAKVDIAKSKLKDMNIKVEYTITIKNNGETAGYASEITDYIPEGFTFDSNSNPNWVQNNGYITTNALADEIINPNETKEVKLILEWNNSEIGQKTNISEISKHTDENKNSDVVDIDSIPNNKVETEDDLDLTNIILTVKTGSEEITIILTALGFMAIVSLGIVGYKKIVNNL